MPHLGFSYGLSGLNSGPLDCHDNIQLIDIALSPQRLPSQFFHFVVLFLNPQSILIKSQKKTKLLQKKSYKEGRLFNTQTHTTFLSSHEVQRSDLQETCASFQRPVRKDTICKKHAAGFGVYQDRLAKLEKHVFSNLKNCLNSEEFYCKRWLCGSLNGQFSRYNMLEICRDVYLINYFFF